MGVETWGTMSKSQDDNETIEEAIVRLIAVHNEASDAHLDEGGSLSNHAASEIIDHLADSIISDKVSKNQIKFDQLALEDYFLEFLTWSSLDGYSKGVNGANSNTTPKGSQVTLNAGNDNGGYAWIRSINSYNHLFICGKVTKFFFLIASHPINSNCEMYIGFTESGSFPPTATSDSVLFKIIGSRIWTSSGSATTNELQDTGVDLPNAYVDPLYYLRIEVLPGTGGYVKFYAGGALISTHSIKPTGNSDGYFFASCKKTASDAYSYGLNLFRALIQKEN